jgi:hypothetical protein
MEPLLPILNLKTVLIISLLSSFSCTKNVTAEAPTEAYEAKKIVNEVSYLTAPIEIDIIEIQNQLNQNFKGLIYDDSSFEGDDIKFKIWKNTNLTFLHRNGGVFEFRVPLKIWVEKRVSVLGMTQTPSTEFEIIAKFSSKPFISANWELKTLTNAEGFDWISQPRLSLGGFAIPITSIVGGIIDNNQASIARLIDENVSKEVDLVSPILNVWNGLKEPMKLSDEYNLWVQVIPQDVLMSELTYTKTNIKTSIAIKAVVNSSVGELKTKIEKSSLLPPIKFANNLPKGFSIYLNNLVTFSEAEKIAKGMLIGQKIPMREGKEIEILGLRIYGGAENKLIIQLNTAGDLNGVIFLKGDPYFDEKKREIILKNIELDLKTKNLLVKAASWFMEGTIVKEIEKAFGIPVDPIFDQAKSSTNKYLNADFNNGLHLSGRVKEISPGTVYLKSEGLMTTAIVEGDIDVKLSSFAAKK